MEKRSLQNIEKEVNYNFSKNTTYGLGGNAEVAYFPKTQSEVCKIFDYMQIEDKKFVVLGCGSNVLASEKFYDGAVISTKKLNKIRYRNGYLYCESGVKVAYLLKYCLQHGLSGLEYLAGIPATVGGLALMNGGIRFNHIGQNIIWCKVYDGKMRIFSNKKCNFANKHSTMRDIICIICSVKLKVEQKSSEQIKEKINYYLNLRKALPKGRSCGCVFKNLPDGTSAGKLIEKCGLKGYKLGNTEVSSAHANFILNNSGNSDSVYRLINFVKQKVFNTLGVLLEEEVVYIGEFNDSYS